MSTEVPDEYSANIQEALLEVGVLGEGVRNPEKALDDLINNAREVQLILEGLDEKKKALETELFTLNGDAANGQVNRIREVEQLIKQIKEERSDIFGKLAEVALIVRNMQSRREE